MFDLVSPPAACLVLLRLCTNSNSARSLVLPRWRRPPHQLAPSWTGRRSLQPHGISTASRSVPFRRRPSSRSHSGPFGRKQRIQGNSRASSCQEHCTSHHRTSPSQDDTRSCCIARLRPRLSSLRYTARTTLYHPCRLVSFFLPSFRLRLVLVHLHALWSPSRIGLPTCMVCCSCRNRYLCCPLNLVMSDGQDDRGSWLEPH